MEVLKDKTTVLLILWLALTSEFNGKCRNIQGFATGGCSMRVDEPGALAEIKQQLHFLCWIPFIKTPLWGLTEREAPNANVCWCLWLLSTQRTSAAFHQHDMLIKENFFYSHLIAVTVFRLGKTSTEIKADCQQWLRVVSLYFWLAGDRSLWALMLQWQIQSMGQACSITSCSWTQLFGP